MTTNEIADVILKNVCERGFPCFLTTFQGAGFNEADVFSINKNGYMYEFEIKRSRSDFLADFKNKKYKHQLLKERDAVRMYSKYVNGKRTAETEMHIHLPNRFFFACEPGLISPQELPEYCGLVYITANGLEEVKVAKLLHRNKATELIYKRVATILSQRIIYGCSYYTHKFK